MKLNFKGQTALVTGASAGIGRELARGLAAKGVSRLILVARRTERLEELGKELKSQYPALTVMSLSCDLGDLEACKTLLAEIRRQAGPVDLLINNAGVGDYGLLETADWDKLQSILRLNLISLTYLSHQLVPGMIARGRGGILNISSIAGLLISPGRAVYSASKYYVDGFSEGLRLELAGTGVSVTQVCPGPVTSEFSRISGSNAHPGSRPAFLEISAETCARESLDAFARGQALSIPGAKTRFVTEVLRRVPRPLMRVSLPGLRHILKPEKS